MKKDPRQKLWEAYLNLAEKHAPQMEPAEFGFAMIEFTATLLLDCAPDEHAAREVIRVGVHEGFKRSRADREQIERRRHNENRTRESDRVF